MHATHRDIILGFVKNKQFHAISKIHIILRNDAQYLARQHYLVTLTKGRYDTGRPFYPVPGKKGRTAFLLE